VVLTMLASKSFDPRLIWDPIESTVGKGSTFRCDFPHEAITSPESQVKLDQLA
jgi:hypothetical protein